MFFIFARMAQLKNAVMGGTPKNFKQKTSYYIPLLWSPVVCVVGQL